MWTAILGIVSSLLGYFLPKPPDPTIAAHDAGVKEGTAETENAAAQGELKDVETANAARDAVRAADASKSDGVRQPNEFSRD